MTKFGAWVQRTAWSALANALGGIVVGPLLFSVDVWKGAGLAALNTVISSLLIYARAQADTLPEVTVK